MKGHKEHHDERKHRETGGVNEAKMDIETKGDRYTHAPKIEDEAEKRKRGGHVEAKHKKHGGEIHHHTCKCHKCTGGKVEARKRGGHVMHEGFGPEGEATKKRGGEVHKKHVGHVEGEHAKHHAGRKPRKAGGRASSDENPFTSARHGEAPKGRSLDMEME
jgi:hypothetical protein